MIPPANLTMTPTSAASIGCTGERSEVYGMRSGKGGERLFRSKVYLKDGRAKLEIALAKGKNYTTKRAEIEKRDFPT